ncbi:recombinase family protein [Microbacterium sp. NPDC079995]|uniref:recombinase family protein n=1 Tax=unclassified Microbacterium TaxID=2609290 RepID=UPI00344E77D1
MKVVAYIRVSTAKQDLSMDAQRNLIERYAAYREHEVVAFVTDPDVSGKVPIAEREGGGKMLGLLHDGEAHGVIVTKLDRLSRDLPDFASTLGLFRKRGWSIAALDLDIDTATANGEMVANMLINLSQWERRTISERTKTALAELKRQGKPVGRPAVTSLDSDVVNYITMRRGEGARVSVIARELNEAGHTPPTGKQFYPSSVAKLLKRVADAAPQAV